MLLRFGWYLSLALAVAALVQQPELTCAATPPPVAMQPVQSAQQSKAAPSKPAAAAPTAGATTTPKQTAAAGAAAAMPATGAAGGAKAATSLPAALPLLTVTAVAPQPLKPGVRVADGYFALTPAGCGGAGAAPCAGFKVSNQADFRAGATNAARFVPPATTAPQRVDPFNPQTYYLASVQLSSDGLQQPTGAGMALVPVRAQLEFATEGAGNASLALDLTVMWSLGSPAPPNKAALFALVTRNPAPRANVSVPVGPGRRFSYQVEVLGFGPIPDQPVGTMGLLGTPVGTAAAGAASGVTFLGDWGQEPPASGVAGPRVYVPAGAPQPRMVGLYARISRLEQ